MQTVHWVNDASCTCLICTFPSYLPKQLKKICSSVKSILAGKPWYYDTPLGHNTLKKKLKNLFLSAGLDAENISNHSIRATGVTRLYDEGVPEKLIMERSGHLSTSRVRSYEHTISQQKKDVSDILAKASSTGYQKPLSFLNLKQERSDDQDLSSQVQESEEMKVSEVLKHFNFEKVDGCTFNFNFSAN